MRPAGKRCQRSMICRNVHSPHSRSSVPSGEMCTAVCRFPREEICSAVCRFPCGELPVSCLSLPRELGVPSLREMYVRVCTYRYHVIHALSFSSVCSYVDIRLRSKVYKFIMITFTCIPICTDLVRGLCIVLYNASMHIVCVFRGHWIFDGFKTD